MTTRQTVTIQTPSDRDQIARWARNVETGTVVTFRKKSRSSEQSAKMWAMLGEVSAQVEWYGQKLDAEDWKDVFTASLRHARVVPGIDKGTYVPLGMHTSTLTIEEMSNLIELIYAFGAEHGVVFKDPKEQDSGTDPQPEAEGAALSSPQEPADTAPKSAGSDITQDEIRTHLMDFARKALATAGDHSLPDPKRLELVEFMQANYRDVLPDTEWGKLSTIMIGVQAVLSGKRTIDQARRFFAVDLLETTVEELGG